MRAGIDRLSSPFRISIPFQFWSERFIDAATCSTVTNNIGDRNQAVPLTPSTFGRASFSSKYRTMLTVE